jgi:arylsulfatase A-like enzyme
MPRMLTGIEPSGARVKLLTRIALCLVLVAAAGCIAHHAAHPGVAHVLFEGDELLVETIVVPGYRDWVDTGMQVQAGEPLTFLATGRIGTGTPAATEEQSELDVDPRGTFLYSDAVQGLDFPLPAAAQGPAPCFCLIARVGDSPPFYVGERMSLPAPATGRLWLGVNDPCVEDNSGEFHVQVNRPPELQPMAFREIPPPDEPICGGPQPGCQVVVFYVDGLRPDVVEEMVAMGHLPNIRRHFVEGGTYLANAFTSFPSDTITSNGCMWTGCFSDRHGLKGQVRFNRHSHHSDSYLEPIGPNRSARQLGPQSWDRAVHVTKATVVGLTRGEEREREWRDSRTSDIPAIYDYLRAAGCDWSTSVLPVMTKIPPILWTRSMSKHMPYFKAHEAWKYNDDANAHYTVQYLLGQRERVTVLWLPETDSYSHKECRGQFGSARRAIARADALIGDVTTELEARGCLENTYLVLVSDHGHVGGEQQHLSRYDLANEFFFRPRAVTPDGRWVGGGLGLSVRQHRYDNRHAGARPLEFVFLDADATGAARVHLPQCHYRSGDWSRPNRAADLLSYSIADEWDPVDMLSSIASVAAVDDSGCAGHPVDHVVAKISDCSILITTCDRGQAVIERRWDESGQWVYRYVPVTNVQPATNGEIAFDEIANPTTDPLCLAGHVPADFFAGFHNETIWLWATADSEYPDSVVSFARHMLWQDDLRPQELEYAPDLVVTARRGWFFGTQNMRGSSHGHPLPESMHATLYVSGPNVRCGSCVAAPCRLVDLTPTILELAGVPFDAEFMDGQALRTIYNAYSESQTIDSSDELLLSKSRSRATPLTAKIATRIPVLRRTQVPPRDDSTPHGSNALRMVGVGRTTHQLTFKPNDFGKRAGLGPLVEFALKSDTRSPKSSSRLRSIRAEEVTPASFSDGVPFDDCCRQPLYWHDIELRAWNGLIYAPQPVFEHQPLTINHPESPWDVNNMIYGVLTTPDWNVYRLVDDVVSLVIPGRLHTQRGVEWIGLQGQRSNQRWIAEATLALDPQGFSLSDYSYKTLGNMKRMNGTLDWLQNRNTDLDRLLAEPMGRSSLPGTPLVHGAIDGIQWSFWESYHFAVRVAAEVLDEKLLNGLENGVDATLNAPRRIPENEIIEE